MKVEKVNDKIIITKDIELNQKESIRMLRHLKREKARLEIELDRISSELKELEKIVVDDNPDGVIIPEYNISKIKNN
jgi:hypothetical protein